MWRIEWPPGSGRKASYTPDEVDLLGRLIEMCERGELPEAELGNQLDVLHELKLQFGGHLEPATRVASSTGLSLPESVRSRS